MAIAKSIDVDAVTDFLFNQHFQSFYKLAIIITAADNIFSILFILQKTEI